MSIDIHNYTEFFSNEEILKHPELNWDNEYIILKRNFTVEELRKLNVDEVSITCLHGKYEDIINLSCGDNELILKNVNVTFEDKLKYFEGDKDFTNRTYLLHGTDEQVMEFVDYSHINFRYRRNVTLELLHHYGYRYFHFKYQDISYESFIKHLNELKTCIDNGYSVSDNILYKMDFSDILFAPWMTIDLAIEIESIFQHISHPTYNPIDPKLISMKFPLSNLIKYGIDKVNIPSIVYNPDINNIIHHLPRIPFESHHASKVLSLANLRRYFPDYREYKEEFRNNTNVTMKEALEYECNDIRDKLYHTRVQDIPHEYLCKVKHPERIKDITVRIYELFQLKRYDHIHRINSSFIYIVNFNDVDFIF
ncbi:hypothetical protein D3C87_906950 [compost metagenome]